MLYFPDFNAIADSDKEPLVIHRHGGVSKPALIILVHGLGGSRYRTWTAEEPTQSGLPKFLYDDIGDLDIGLYAYPSFLKRWRWWQSIELEDEADSLADRVRQLVRSPIDHNYSTIILAGHSMGGILVRAAIRKMINSDDRQTLAAVKALFLLASPQAGSLNVPRSLHWLTADTRALAPHNRVVTKIEQTFTNRVASHAAHANPGQFVIPAYVVAGTYDQWVDRFSAGLGVPDERKCIVRGSHKSVVKPIAKTDDVYLWIRDRLVELVYEGAQQANPFEACELGGKLLLNRKVLRQAIRDVANDKGNTRVIAIKGPPRSGKSHSIYFIEHIEQFGSYEKAAVRLEGQPATFGPVDLVASILNLIGANATQIPNKPRVDQTEARWVQLLASHVVGHVKARPKKVLIALDGFADPNLPLLTRELIRELVKQADFEPRLRVALLDYSDDLLVATTAGRLITEPIGVITEIDLRFYFNSLARSQGRSVPPREVLDDLVRSVLERALPSEPGQDDGDPAAYNERIAQEVESWAGKLRALR